MPEEQPHKGGWHNRIPQLTRARIIKLYSHDHRRQAEIARMFKLSHTTVHSIIRRWEAKQPPEPKPVKRPKPKHPRKNNSKVKEPIYAASSNLQIVANLNGQVDRLAGFIQGVLLSEARSLGIAEHELTSRVAEALSRHRVGGS